MVRAEPEHQGRGAWKVVLPAPSVLASLGVVSEQKAGDITVARGWDPVVPGLKGIPRITRKLWGLHNS